MAGQIIRRGDSTFLVRVFLGRDADTGKRRYHNKTLRGTKKDAQRYLNGVLRQLDLGEFVEPTAITLNQFLDRWLEAALKPRVRAKTFFSYVDMLKRHVRPELGGRRLCDVSPLDVQSLYGKLLERGLSPRSVRYLHAILNSVFKQAVRWQMLARNPASGAELPKQSRPAVQAFTPDQAAAFLLAAKSDRYAALFSLMLTTGLRPGEAFGLRWPDVDWKRGTVTVRKAISRVGKEWRLEDPKTEKSKRTIPLPQGVLQELAEHRRGQLEERMSLGAEYQDHGLVFAGHTGQPLDLRNVAQRHFKVILRRAGLPETFTLYSLRHSCATLLLAGGENLKVVSERLGHASIVLTADVCSHVSESMQQQATRKLELLLYGQAGTQ
jgi:integrase